MVGACPHLGEGASPSPAISPSSRFALDICKHQPPAQGSEPGDAELMCALGFFRCFSAPARGGCSAAGLFLTVQASPRGWGFVLRVKSCQDAFCRLARLKHAGEGEQLQKWDVGPYAPHLAGGCRRGGVFTPNCCCRQMLEHMSCTELPTPKWGKTSTGALIFA